MATNYFPGYVDLIKLQLINYKGDRVDIKDLIFEIDLYEDIFSNTMSGSLMIEDASGLHSSFPLIGEELLDISFETPNTKSTINKVFYVYKMDSRIIEKDRKQVYILKFISKESIISINNKVSEYFTGKITDNVVDIFKRKELMNSRSDIFIDDPVNSITFTSNYWSPIEIMNWLAQRAISKNKAADYVFYEDNKAFNFVSMGTLMSATPIVDYVYTELNYETIFGEDADPLKDGCRIVRKLHMDVQHDYVKRVQTGMLNAGVNVLDIISRKISTATHDYVKDFNKTPHLEKFPVTTSNAVGTKLANFDFIVKNDYRFTDLNKQRHTEWYVQHQAAMAAIHDNRVIAEVPGSTTMRAGAVITMKINKFDSFSTSESNEIVDKAYSGKYLVTAVRHKIMSNEHTMFLELSKESTAISLTGNKR